MTVQELIESLSKEQPHYEVVFGFADRPHTETYPVILIHGDPLATEEHRNEVVLVGPRIGEKP